MALLEVNDIHASYGMIEALHGITLEVEAGEVVTMIGSNGAGKSTVLRSISGLTPAHSGSIIFDGEEITHLTPVEIVGRGVSHVPEGRRCFPRMTVRENLELGAYLRKDEIGAEMDRVFALFPRLAERQGQAAGTMSGGEQQMLAIGRAMMARPRLILMDEPSMGIAPILVERIYETIAEISQSGTTILLVEQNATHGLAAANRGYVIETGRIVLSGPAATLGEDPKVREAYLGA
jgi:branched-chain amino acid transport system ATP-binding protein